MIFSLSFVRGPNPRRGSISASGFGPGGPNPGGPNPLGHRHDNGANRNQEQMDQEITFNYFIKRNDMTAKES